MKVRIITDIQQKNSLILLPTCPCLRRFSSENFSELASVLFFIKNIERRNHTINKTNKAIIIKSAFVLKNSGKPGNKKYASKIIIATTVAMGLYFVPRLITRLIPLFYQKPASKHR